MPRGCVITIISGSVVILLVSIFYYFLIWPSTQRNGTAHLIYIIEKALVEYQKDFEEIPINNSPETCQILLGVNPRKKQYLSPNNVILRSGKLVDYWKRPFNFNISHEKPSVLSSGRNGLFGDNDDITSRLFRNNFKNKQT